MHTYVQDLCAVLGKDIDPRLCQAPCWRTEGAESGGGFGLSLPTDPGCRLSVLGRGECCSVCQAAGTKVRGELCLCVLPTSPGVAACFTPPPHLPLPAAFLCARSRVGGEGYLAWPRGALLCLDGVAGCLGPSAAEAQAGLPDLGLEQSTLRCRSGAVSPRSCMFGNKTKLAVVFNSVAWRGAFYMCYVCMCRALLYKAGGGEPH